MQRRYQTAAVVAAVAGLGLLAGGCSQYNMLRGRQAVKDAYILYQQQDWKRAAQRFEEAVTLNPGEKAALFYLGNSYDNLYKPARKGDAENDALLTKAVEYYRKAAEEDPDIKMRKLALQYLVNAYGADRLDDPGQAEPLVKRMIELEPKESSNYFVLARMYEDSGQYELAEETLLSARQNRPDDAAVYKMLAGYYNRLGDFEKTMQYMNERAQREPTNPEAHYEVGSYYWDKAFRDTRLKEPEKMNYIKLGLEAIDKALSINPNYDDALVYKGLLMRSQALLEKDPARAQALVKEADGYRERAMELKKKKAAGAP